MGASWKEKPFAGINDELQLIFTDTTCYKKQLSFSDLKNLYQLENDLNQTIFNKIQLKISLCDHSFNEIMILD